MLAACRSSGEAPIRQLYKVPGKFLAYIFIRYVLEKWTITVFGLITNCSPSHKEHESSSTL
jgi:hypothetical protein